MLSLIFCFLMSLSYAQDFFSFLTPQSGSTSIEMDGAFMPESDVETKGDSSRVAFSSFAINQKVYNGEKNIVTVGARHQKLDLNSNSPLLRDYYNQQVSVSLRTAQEDNKFAISSVSYGSASDRPFKNGRDGTISLNYIRKFNDRWFGIANYSNNRAFLNNVPLPGFLYVEEMSKERVFIVGFPIFFWQRPIFKDISFRYIGILPWSHRLKVLYTKNDDLKPYIGVEQTPSTFFRHDRKERFDRFFWFEKRLMVGVEANISKQMRVDLSGGLVFDRQFFEARNFSEKKEFLLNMENSYFASLSLRYNF